MTDKVLSIVIPVFNKFNFTKTCLNDLSKLSNDHQVIVIDNGSTDETQSQLENSKDITYHRNPENYGFAKASNIGYSLSAAPNVLFLNNDIRVRENKGNWTSELIKWCPHALVGPTMGQLDNQLNFVQEANRVLPGKSYMSGWCLASSKEIWEKLRIKDYAGPFSEEFGLAFFEDTDTSFRARQLDIPMQVVTIPVVHFGHVTSNQLNTNKLYKSAREIFVKKWNNKL
jgi:GT2 family glycosyltransferase